MKHILIIGDGMADNPLDVLGGKTPLEAANIPYIDSLAARGEVFSARTVPHGAVPGSDTANLTIFGCDPNLYYTGRAPLEAASAGIALPEGSAAYRCNVISVSDGDGPFEEKTLVSHSAGSIDGNESDALVNWLFNDPVFKTAADSSKMHIYPASSFRHIAVQENADLKGIRLDPPHDYLGERVGDHTPKGNDNAEVLWRLMVLAHERLNHCAINEKRRGQGLLPANAIWFWAEGTAVTLPQFSYSKNGTVISAVPLFKGIARLTGLKTVDVEGATGLLNTNYKGKVDAALKALYEGDDFVTIHIEAPDECSHDGDLEGKIQSIENLDNLVVRPLLEALDARDIPYRILVLSDHKTLLSNRAHDGDPVPCLLYASGTDTRRGGVYSEAEGEKGEHLDPGTQLMGRLFQNQLFLTETLYFPGGDRMDSVTRKAYAKLNLTLDVTGRREDGYHTILSVMQLVDLYDTVTLAKQKGTGILLESGAAYLPRDARNSAWKAAQAFFRSAEIEPQGLSIKITKKIPVGAGMGGGSADAAAVLLGLKELFSKTLPEDKLLSAGAGVGADVPFCIKGGTALAEGIGEMLTPLPALPDCDIVLCKPPYGCSTPLLYQRYDTQKHSEHPDTEGIIDALRAGRLDKICRRLFNVFENLLPEHARDIFDMKDTMLDYGALGASMTGTGSAIFGIFTKDTGAADAMKALQSHGYEAWVTKPQK